MKSKVVLNLNNTNYLKKGETPIILEKGFLMTKMSTKRGGKVNEFEVSNELMKIWFV